MLIKNICSICVNLDSCGALTRMRRFFSSRNVCVPYVSNYSQHHMCHFNFNAICVEFLPAQKTDGARFKNLFY
ncbi:MAG TPA: hypothetical protein PLI57_09930 [Spirochaetota bacterium]|nr:hypothetical protein [Spirochaetota bacterium]